MIEKIEIISGLIAGVIAVWYTVRKRLKERGVKIWTSAFEGSTDIDNLLMAFANKYPEVDAVTLMICQNGGGLPHPTSKISTSILSEGYTDNLYAYKDHWQEQLVEPYYKSILSECLTDGRVHIQDSDNLKASAFKNAVLALKIKSFQLVFVSAEKHRWYYIVLSSVKENDFDNPKFKDDSRYLINQLIDIIDG